jgi:hypothetical protein
MRHRNSIFRHLSVAIIFATALTAMFLGDNLSRAASIGVNFVGNNGANGTLGSGVSAGLVPQTNWNNLSGATPAATNLVDSTGAASTVDLTATGGGGVYVAHAGGAGTATVGGDEALNSGFIYASSHVVVNEIPYPRYDVYVYQLNDASGRQQTTTLTPASGPAVSYYGSSPDPAAPGYVDNAATPYVYNRATSQTAGTFTTNANYARFENVTGSTFALDVSAPGNGYLNGLQIVQVVPEPSTLLLGLGGLLALVALGRKARRSG